MSVAELLGGRYRLVDTIGSGGMAVVHHARDDVLERDVAIKVLADNLSRDEEFRARFVREARIAGALSHPNVIAIYDVGEDDGRPFIVMEHAAGGSLHDRLQREGALPAEDTVEYLRQCAEGLAFAHAQGVIHRDVKPGNVLISRTGCVKVADFGIARPLDDTRLTQPGSVLGTARYLAPEQATGEPGSPASDVYSLGVCLWEMLTGAPPFDRPLPSGLRAGIGTLVRSCLSADPAARPSAAEVAVVLAEPADMDAPTRVMPRRGRRRAGDARAQAAVAVGALVALLAGLALADGATGEPAGDPVNRPAARVDRVPGASTPQEQAAKLARWIEQHAR